MKQAEQLALIQQINDKGIALMKSKGHDYAGEDILKNFKQMQQMCEILGVDTTRIEGIHMFYVLLKIQRLCNLMFSYKIAKNESVDDTLIDLRNYVDLLHCTVYEKREKEVNAIRDHEIIFTEQMSGETEADYIKRVYKERL